MKDFNQETDTTRRGFWKVHVSYITYGLMRGEEGSQRANTVIWVKGGAAPSGWAVTERMEEGQDDGL